MKVSQKKDQQQWLFTTGIFKEKQMILFTLMLACGEKEAEDTSVETTEQAVDTAEQVETDPQDTATEDTAAE